MSSAPPPYGPPPGQPGGYPAGPPTARPAAPPRPQKERPSAGWFVLGLGLFLVATLVGIGLFVWLLVGLFDFDTIVDADGQPHDVTVGTDRDRMLWMDSTTQSCDVVDRDTGRPIPLEPVSGDFSRSDSEGDFEGMQRFDPGSGHLELTCTQTDGTTPGPVMVSAYPRLGSAAAGLVLAIAVPGLLGLAGLVIILWVGVLWSLRPARARLH